MQAFFETRLQRLNRDGSGGITSPQGVFPTAGIHGVYTRNIIAPGPAEKHFSYQVDFFIQIINENTQEKNARRGYLLCIYLVYI